MKFAFSTNAYRNYSIEDSILSIKNAGYDAVEIMCDVPHAFPPVPEDKLDSIKSILDKNSMKVSNLNGFMMTAVEDFHHPSWIEESYSYRQKRIEHTKNCIHLASILGAKTVSTEPGGPATGQGHKKELELFKQGINEVLPMAEDLQISLLIEPEPELLIENSNQFTDFIKQFDSENIGLNFDVGHFFCVGEDPPSLIRELKEYIHHVHLEDINSKREHVHLIPGHGNVDFKEIFVSLKAINYEGFVTVELYPYQENPQDAAADAMTFLKSVMKDA